MTSKLQPVRGTHDILPDEFEKFQAALTRARELAALYGYREMATPIFEATEVFSRSMGETSDVVSKEMFTFQTKGEESVTLRPEFTAGIARAFISNGMQQDLPLKLFSTGPAFRYERPQKGRQRQFHQVNFESLGDASPEADVEIILLAGQLLYVLSGEQGCTLLINTLGDKESRVRYREALVSFLTPLASGLSEDSNRRLGTNPLRILDSKDPRDKEIVQKAPKITDYLSDTSKTRFEYICRVLGSQKIPFFQEVHIDPSLVRGLDYYTDTVFEFVANTGDLGAQNTVLAGGRYDGLIEQMGGKSTAAVGFAAGVERLLLLMDPSACSKTLGVKAYILPEEGLSFEGVHHAATHLRLLVAALSQKKIRGFRASVEVLWEGSLKKRMERANKRGATHVILLDAPGMKEGRCMVRDMKLGTQDEAPIGNLLNDFKTLAERLVQS